VFFEFVDGIVEVIVSCGVFSESGEFSFCLENISTDSLKNVAFKSQITRSKNDEIDIASF
jgi:hypothetical protein